VGNSQVREQQRTQEQTKSIKEKNQFTNYKLKLQTLQNKAKKERLEKKKKNN
jgi:hypothetical protein